jgi:FkbM family methyltransferase
MTSSIKQLARALIPRRVRVWLRNPVLTLRYLRDEVHYRLGRYRQVELRPGWRVRCHPAAYRGGYYVCRDDPEQAAELDCFIRHCRPGMVLFDIGAHFGPFCLAALHYGGDEARALAVEPSPLAVRMMRLQARLNRLTPRWQVQQAAAGDHVGVESLVEAGLLANGYFVAPDVGHDEAEITQVPCVTIDWLVQQTGWVPTHIKIDVEGAEHAVLAGGIAVLRREPAPLLFLEMHNEMVRKRGQDPRATLGLLHDLGYRCYDSQDRPLSDESILSARLIRIVARRELAA